MSTLLAACTAVTSVVMTTATAAGSDTMASRCEALQPVIDDALVDTTIDRALVVGIIAVESGFRADVKSRSGARGLMQIMPSTGRAMRCGDLDDGLANIRCGVALLARLIERYDGRVIYALAAYRSGSRDPDQAFRKKAPIGLAYAEKVLSARTRFLRDGCRAWLPR